MKYISCKIVNYPLSIVHCILYLLLITYPLSQTFAQNHKIDSLKKALKTEKEDSSKVKIIGSIDNQLEMLGRYNEAMIYENEALILAEKIGYKQGIASAFNKIGIIYDDKADYPRALEYYHKALDINTELGDKFGIASNLGNIGLTEENLGNYSTALEYNLKSLPILESINDKEGMASDDLNTGNIYYYQANYPKALEYYGKAVSINKQIKNRGSLGSDYSSMGNVYMYMNEDVKAIQYDDTALQIDAEIGNKDGMSIVCGNLGLIYNNQGNYTKSLEYYFKSLDFEKQINDKRPMGFTYGGIGRVYAAIKNYKKAKVYLDTALKISKDIADKENIANAYASIAMIDSAEGDYNKSLVDYKTFIIYRDSLRNEANTKKNVQTEMNFEFEQKQSAQKAEQDKKDAIAEQGRRKQVIIRNVFIGGFVIMLALAFFIFRGYRQKRRANIIITEQKAVVEEKQKEILDSIHYAQRIQKALLASDALLSRHLPEYFVLYKPKDIVSGDFYWATEKGNSFYLAVCDSTGHGVPGAFMSLLNVSFLNEAITEKNISEPNEVFNHARKRLIENISQEGQQDGMDGVLISLNAGRALSYAAAYNTPVVIRNKEMIELNADKMPIGASPRQNESFIANTFNLQKGDLIYLFTDGYADQFGGPKGKKFKHAQLSDTLKAISNKSMAEQKSALEKTFMEWKGSLDQIDDVLVIGIRV
jgi:serine phosphatase RsbU (regulator of sigma subunit)